MITTSQFVMAVTSSAIDKKRIFESIFEFVIRDWGIVWHKLTEPFYSKCSFFLKNCLMINQPSFICFTDSIGNNPRIVLLFPFTIQILPCARFLHAGCVWPLTRLITQKILYKRFLATKQTGSNVCSFYWLFCTKVLVYHTDPNPPKESSMEPKMSLQHIVTCVRSA